MLCTGFPQLNHTNILKKHFAEAVNQCQQYFQRYSQQVDKLTHPNLESKVVKSVILCQ